MTYFSSGHWNALCDVCGFKFKSYELRKRWDGLMVCQGDFEQDHPQKFLRVREDPQAVPWTRDRPEDLDAGPVCDYWNSSPIAGFAEAGCAQVGGNTSIQRLIELYYPGTSCIAAIAVAGLSIPGVI